MATVADGSNLLRWSLAALSCAGMIAVASAQDLALERSAVLRSFGEVDDPDLELFPVLQTPGRIVEQPLDYTGAESLRLRFVRLDDDAIEGTWSIRILQDDEVKSVLGGRELASGSYWSDEYPGRKLVVEIHSTVARNPIQILISDVAVTKKAPVRLSITGNNDLSPIASHDDWVQEMGKSIARLRFNGDDRKIYSCTAFMMAPGLMLTNQHCIATQSELESALVDFDFDSVIADTLFTRLSQLVASDHDLDYSIVRLTDTIDRPPLLFSATTALADADLIIIQHPGGEPKQVSVEDCAVGAPLVNGRTKPDTDFEHLCDTQTGSSGSPVIDKEQRFIVGLHHLGFEEDNNNLHNRAVHIGLIRADIESKLGPLSSIIDPQ